jgi:hypothetical protein
VTGDHNPNPAGPGNPPDGRGDGPLQLAEPIWVPMTEEEHRRAVEALGALFAWAVTHPEEWQE